MIVCRILKEMGVTEILHKFRLTREGGHNDTSSSDLKRLEGGSNLKKSEFLRVLKQSVLSLSFNLGGMLTGTLLASYFGVFYLAPWTLAIYPGILSMRGIIGGLFCGRLSTGLHIGTIRADFTANTRNFYLLWRAIVTLTFTGSILLGAVATFFGIFFWEATLLDLMSILGVVIATMALSIVFISPITVAVAVLAYNRGLDPDIVVYPVISTTADIIVTVCYVVVLTVAFSSNQTGGFIIGFLNFIFLAFVLYILYKDIREKEFVKTIRESIFTLLSLAVIVNITGSFLTRITEKVGSKPEIYTVYPAILGTIGDLGSIIGSTATTKLALGMLTPSFSSIKRHATQIVGTWAASLVMYTIYSISSSLIHGATPWRALKFTTTLYTTNVFSASSMTIIAFAVGILTYRRGLDPDNFVIPIESSLADTVTTLSLLATLNLIG